jgi:hypothetical protein
VREREREREREKERERRRKRSGKFVMNSIKKLFCSIIGDNC